LVKIGLLGAGFVSTFYMLSLKEIKDQEVVYVYSRTEKDAKAFAEKWKIPKWTTDMIKVVEDKDVDLVIIGLPNFLHKEAAVLSAKNGKNVVCTKPLAINANEAKEMLDSVKKAGVLHGYAETRVFSPYVMKVHEIIEKGIIGDVYWIRSREGHFGPHSAWFWDPKLSGGGAMLDMGCHTVEAARYFLGKNVKSLEAIAFGETLVHPVESEDNAILVVKYEGKKVSLSETSWSAHGGLDLRDEIYGSDGTLFINLTKTSAIQLFTLKNAGYVLEKSEIDSGWLFPATDEPRTLGYFDAMKHFVECIKKGIMPRETFEDGYIVNLILDAGYRSIKTKKWEKIELG